MRRSWELFRRGGWCEHGWCAGWCAVVWYVGYVGDLSEFETIPPMNAFHEDRHGRSLVTPYYLLDDSAMSAPHLSNTGTTWSWDTSTPGIQQIRVMRPRSLSIGESVTSSLNELITSSSNEECIVGGRRSPTPNGLRCFWHNLLRCLRRYGAYCATHTMRKQSSSDSISFSRSSSHLVG